MKKIGFITKQRLIRFAYTTGLLSLVLAVALSLSAGGALAANLFATAEDLGDAESFAVLADRSAKSYNMTTIWGDLGLSTGVATSRTGPWTVLGKEYFGPTSLAADARTDALAAYNNLAGQGTSGPWSLNTSPAPGVWTTASSATFTGTLTLSGDYDDVWVFQIGESLTFTGDVVMAGDAQACNVFWQVGTDATIASGSKFVGTLIASRDITVVSGATVSGRIISLNRDITVDANTITYPPCEVQQEFSLNLAKAATPLTYENVGDEINYTYTLTNTGSETLYAPFSVTDNLLTVDCPDSLTMATGESLVCTASTTIDQDDLDAGSITNTASATAMDEEGEQKVTSNEDSETVTIVPEQEPTAEPTTEPTAEPTAEPTKKPTAKPTTEPGTHPDTGGDLAGPGSQIIRISLGALGLTLILFGFILSRRIQKAER